MKANKTLFFYVKRVFFLFFVPLFMISCGTGDKRITWNYNKNDTSWYCRETGITKWLININEGDPQESIDFALKQGVDAEAYYVKALAYAKSGNCEKAYLNIDSAYKAGFCLNRAILPLKLNEPLKDCKKAYNYLMSHKTDIMNGPKSGAITSNSAQIWLRTVLKKDVAIEYSENNDFSNSKKTKKQKTDEYDEFTAKINLSALQPNTKYFYKVYVDGKEKDKVHSFKTFSEKGENTLLTIGFGGGAAHIPWHEHVWDTVNTHNLDAFLFLGDNVYIDHPKYPEIQRYVYYRRGVIHSYRRFISSTPLFSIWDDHDFGKNDSYGTNNLDSFAWKTPVLNVFKNQWPNPGFGTDTIPGIFYTFNAGDVKFYMLDCRYYREPCSLEDTTTAPAMLGHRQMKWLKKELNESAAKINVIVSSVPWAYPAKGGLEGRYDTWRGYKKEREEIFSFLTENKIDGVVLMSADRHRSDLWKIERKNDYDLYEFESSKLTNTHTHKEMPGVEFSYNEKCSFGKVIFNTKKEKPSITYEIWNIDNEKVFEKVIFVSELK